MLDQAQVLVHGITFGVYGVRVCDNNFRLFTVEAYALRAQRSRIYTYFVVQSITTYIFLYFLPHSWSVSSITWIIQFISYLASICWFCENSIQISIRWRCVRIPTHMFVLYTIEIWFIIQFYYLIRPICEMEFFEPFLDHESESGWISILRSLHFVKFGCLLGRLVQICRLSTTFHIQTAQREIFRVCSPNVCRIRNMWLPMAKSAARIVY